MDGEVQPLNLSEFRNSKNSSPEFVPKDIPGLNTQEYTDYLNSAVKSINPEKVIPQMNEIAVRFGEEMDKVDLNDETTFDQENMVGKGTSDLIWRLAHANPPVKIEKSTLEKLYSYVKDPHELKRTYALSFFPTLVSLDNNNGVDSLHIEDRFVSDLTKEIMAHEPTEDNTIPELLKEANDNMPQKMGDFLVRSLKIAQSDEEILKLFVAYSNATSFNEARRALLNYSQGNDAFHEILKRTENVTGLTLSEDKEIHSDNNDFYKNMNKNDYVSYNELTDSEVDFLVDQTTEDEEILDVGSGTGRIMVPLSKRNRNVSGIDISEEDVKTVNELYPNLRNELGSWHKINREDGSVDVIDSLARGPLQNSTPQEWLSMLKEFNRVLRNISRDGRNKGRVYLDMPDNSSTHYKKHTQDLVTKLRKIGIKRIFKNSMIDTPDQKNYIDRLSPDPDQLVAMAALAGFDARKIASKEYHDDEGNPVTNNYWQLTKSDRVLTDEEENEAMKTAFEYAEEDERTQEIPLAS